MRGIETEQRDYSCYFMDARGLIERLKEAEKYVYDNQALLAINDAIVYIERHFFYDR